MTTEFKEFDKTGLADWAIDTDTLTTCHLWIPPDCDESIARAVMDSGPEFNAGEHGGPVTLEVELPDGRYGLLELTCIVPKRTGRAIVDVTDSDHGYDLGPDDSKTIDAREWDSKRIAEALTAYETAADLPALLAAAEAFAKVVRASMIGAPARPTQTAAARIAEQVARLGEDLAEEAAAFDRESSDDGGGLLGDAEHAVAATLAGTAYAAAELLSGRPIEPAER